jgi:hypothetical protein
MAKFRSISHEVTAVQWKGEVTPEVQALFATREITVKPAGDPLLVVHTTDGRPMFAKIGDWVIRTDYGTSERGPEFDLEVMEREEFAEAYESADDARQEFGLEFGVPAALITANGNTEAEVRIKFSGVKASRSVLEAIRDQLGAQLGASATAPSIPTVPVAAVTKAAERAGVDLSCRACAVALYDFRPPHDTAPLEHKHDCRTIAAIRDRLR